MNDSEEDTKINLNEVTEKFQRIRRDTELERNRIVNVIFLGNLGVGKSTLASILLHSEEGFEAGSDETGLTKTFNEKINLAQRYTIIDTPGLVREANREDIGLQSLRHVQRGGKCKIIFVATTSQTDLRSEDSTTLLLITKAIKEISSKNGIALIVNKVTDSLQQKWESTIPYIPEIDGISDPVSKIPKANLENIKKVLGKAIQNCPTISISKADVDVMESRTLNHSAKEKKPVNITEKITSAIGGFFGAKESSKKTREPPNHHETEPNPQVIEPKPQKKVKLNPHSDPTEAKEKTQKRNQTSEMVDSEFDNSKEVIRESDDYQKEDCKRTPKKCMLVLEQYQNYKKMPQCFEKSVIFLLYFTTMQSSSDLDFISNFNIHFNEKIDFKEMIDKELELLEASAKIEEQISKKVLEKIQSAKKQRNWKALSQLLEVVLKSIRSLDIKYLMTLFEKVHDAAESIKEQDLFLLLGFTGAGKSTLTYFLAGSKMEEQNINGFYHIGPVGEIKNPDLKNVISSPYTTSQTRYITPVKIDLDGRTIVLCDCPGFEDTDGPEVDIASCFGIVTAVRGCKSVKPIVLLSNKSGDRFQAVKRIAHILVGMMPSVKDELSSFSYVFTKFPPNELRSIPFVLNDIINNLKPDELADESFVLFLRDIRKKVTDKRGSGPMSIDVINDDPELILDYFKATASIKRPDEVFKVSISPQSKSALEEQVRKHQLTIISASMRAEFALIKYKMDELKEINEVLHQDFIQNVYDECVGLLTKTVNQNYHDAVEYFTHRLTSKDTLTKVDLQKYKEFIKKAEKSELLRDGHLGQEMISLEAYEIKVRKEIETLCSEISSTSLDDIIKIKEIADKVRIVSDSFPSFRSEYDALLDGMVELIDTAYSSFEKATKKEEFETSARELCRLLSAQQTLSDHLNSNVLETYEAAQRYFQKMLEDASSKFDDLFTAESFHEKDVTQISNVIKMIISAEKTCTLQPHIPVEIMTQNSNHLIKKIEDFISQKAEKIEKNLNKNNLEGLESEFSQISLLRKVPIVDSRTDESYHNLLGSLCNSVKDIRSDIEATLGNIFQKGEGDHKEFNNNLNHLKAAKWIEKYREGVYQNVFDDVQRQIIQHLNHLKKFVKGANIDLLDNYSQLIPTWKKVSEALNIQPLSKTIPNINTEVDEIVNEFTHAIESAFSQIIAKYDPGKLEKELEKIILVTSETEKAINYIENSKTISILLPSKEKAARIFNDFFGNYSKLLQYEFNKSIDAIINYDQGSFNRDYFSQKTHNIFKMLCDVDEIHKAQQTSIYEKYFSRVMENWKSALDGLTRDLIFRLNEAISFKTADITNLLTIAKLLGKLDGFVGTTKFSDVFHNYSQKNSDLTFKVHKQLIEDLSNYKYTDVSLEMESLKTKKDSGSISAFQKVVHYFNSSFTDLIETVQDRIVMLSRHLDKNELQMIQKELRNIGAAKRLMKDYIKAPEDVEKFMGVVLKTLSSKVLSYLEGITNLLTGLQFVEAEIKLSHAKLVVELLPNFLSDEVHDHLKFLIDRQKGHLEEIIKEYTQMEPENYTVKPPVRILEKFQEAAATGNDSIYVIAHEKIKSTMRTKLDAYLAESKQHSKGTNPFRKFEIILQYLPSDMKKEYTLEIKGSKTDFNKKKTELQKRLRDEMSSQHRDLKNLKQIYDDSLENGDDSSVMEVRGFIKGEVRKCMDRLTNQFQEFKINETINSVKLICDYNIVFGEGFTEINEYFKNAKAIFSTRIDELFSSLTHPVQRLDMSTVSEETVKLSQARYDEAISIIKFSKRCKMHDSYKEVIPSDLESKYIHMAETIMRSIISFTENFYEGFQKMDAKLLNTSLMALEKWIVLSEQIKSFHANQNDPSLDLTHLVKYLPEKNHINQMKQKLTNEFINFKEEVIRMSQWAVDISSFFKSGVDEHYRKLNEKLSLLKRAVECRFSGLGFKPENLVRECSDFVEKKVLEINSKSQSLLTQILKDPSISESRDFVVYFGHLCSISTNLEIRVPLSIEAMRNLISERANKLEQECNNSIQDPKSFSNALKSLKLLALNTEIFKEKIDSKIDNLLGTYKMVSKNDRGLAKLGVILHSDTIGQIVVSSHKCFDGYANSIFVERTNKHGIDYVLSNVTGDGVNQDRLIKRYKNFLDDYEALVKENLKQNIDLAPLIAKTIMVLGRVGQEKDTILWDSSITDNLPCLIAHIFAIWTLQNATHYLDAQGLEDQENYLMKPHAAQVISIFRILGVGDGREILANNLVQIGTGEGKSLVLAVTACVLALCGFEVSCACYSEYLYKRDLEAYRSLFQCLNLSDCIHYGTFNKLCEDVINRDGEIRKIVGNLISTGNWTETRSEKDLRPRILLIDEVDIFFQPDFYGNIYTPSVSLSDPTVQALTDYIWKNQKLDLRLAKVKISEPYLKCCARFAGWESLIEEAVKDMLADIKTYESHDYVPKEDKITYKDQTNLVSNVVYGYKTLFAYYKEHSKSISLKSLQENTKINIRCGNFSYAEIPKQFTNIMGVTGTLPTPNDPQNQILTQVYDIKKRTFIPSVFGANNLNPEISIKIEKEVDYFNSIAIEIKKGLKNKKRAVLVFFENQKKLMEFYNSECCKNLKISSDVQCLTEEASSQEKHSFVRRSAVAGRINLLTRSFGRGTDFICNDPKIIENGGIHVIQVFVSEEKSEEIQIKGRTARQGAEGSYSMVLLNTSLEKFLITPEDISNFNKNREFPKFKNFILQTKNASIYDVLDERRNTYFKNQFKSNDEYAEFARKQHEMALEFKKHLLAQDKNAVKQFLENQNKGVEEAIRPRILCLMDATGSMSSLLQKAKNTVGTMFQRATNILSENGLAKTCFELQFAVYRNYSNDKDRILEYSPWETKPEILRNFMKKITSLGGLGNEAIEIGLSHANQENQTAPLQLVILIGDMPANTQAEVIERRKSNYGETYWSTTKFKVPTHYKEEIGKLKQSRVPIHAFYVHEDAHMSFQEIATETGGRCEFLDINSNNGAAMLTDLVTEEILRTIGRVTGVGDRFALAYIARYGKSYVCA